MQNTQGSSGYTGYTINLDHLTSEKLGLDWLRTDERATLDEDATLAAYDAELERQVRAMYPGAAIHWIDAYDRTQHVQPGVLYEGAYGETDAPADADEVAIWRNVGAVAQMLFDDGNQWMVEAPTTRTVTVNGRAFTVRAAIYDNGYAPEATDEQGHSVYLGGEDDDDDATPTEALARGERYLREQAERGNL